ncbi:hypothetical protein GN956_G902 [Arapaima gigas]
MAELLVHYVTAAFVEIKMPVSARTSLSPPAAWCILLLSTALRQDGFDHYSGATLKFAEAQASPCTAGAVEGFPDIHLELPCFRIYFGSCASPERLKILLLTEELDSQTTSGKDEKRWFLRVEPLTSRLVKNELHRD